MHCRRHRACWCVTARRSGAARDGTRRSPTSRSPRTGAQQAAAARRPARRRRASRWCSQPAARARDTCAIAGLGDRAEVTDDLAEWDYGEYEGRTTSEIRATAPGWTIFSGGAPGGETAEQVAARADRVLARGRGGRPGRGVLARALPARAGCALGRAAGIRRRVARARHRDPEHARARTRAACPSGLELVSRARSAARLASSPARRLRAVVVVAMTSGRHDGRSGRRRDASAGSGPSTLRGPCRRRSRPRSSCRRATRSPWSAGSTRRSLSTASVVTVAIATGRSQPVRARWPSAVTTPPVSATAAGSSCSAGADTSEDGIADVQQLGGARDVVGDRSACPSTRPITWPRASAARRTSSVATTALRSCPRSCGPPTAPTFTTVGALPGAGADPALAVVGTAVYLFGGVSNSERGIDTVAVQRFDTASGAIDTVGAAAGAAVACQRGRARRPGVPARRLRRRHRLTDQILRFDPATGIATTVAGTSPRRCPTRPRSSLAGVDTWSAARVADRAPRAAVTIVTAG